MHLDYRKLGSHSQIFDLAVKSLRGPTLELNRPVTKKKAFVTLTPVCDESSLSARLPLPTKDVSCGYLKLIVEFNLA
jgi:hypothetical protein